MSTSNALFLLLCLLISLLPPSFAADIYALIYKGCAKQSLSNGASSQQALAALSSALVAQSASSKFFKTTTSSSSQPIFGLFQCRGDLTNDQCAACVQHILPMWSSLCGASLAARVQLSGCYALYQVSGFPQVSGTQMLFKTCGSGGGGGEGYEEKRDTALANLQSGMGSASSGFYVTSYQSVYAMAQCEGDLSSSDCASCVTQAVQKSEVECGGASSGQVYLDKCYISYNYYPNGAPRGGGDAGGVAGGGGGGSGWGGGGQTGKTVAIVVGGAAGVGFLIICLLFARNVLKKKDDY